MSFHVNVIKKLTFFLFSLLSFSWTGGVLFAAAGPTWWTQRGVVNSAKPAQDYAVANIGQLKHFATKAAAEFNAKLAGGAGVQINSLVASWQSNPVSPQNTAALTLGQLKNVARLFYIRLAETGIIASGKFPWATSGQQSFHTGAANIGQLKAVFSFTIPANETADEDGDSLPDKWEMQNFANLAFSPDTRLSIGGLRVRDLRKFNLSAISLNDGTQKRDASGKQVLSSETPAPDSLQTDIFTYDVQDRLSSAKLGSANSPKNYTNDAEGNITVKN
ncbi:MAG: hypothetical protein LBS59_02095 [Puniceicoccales bacterium]|jgi:hypothetical protein|nr:hypothetical protein [Puniceicoccales bacterium]